MEIIFALLTINYRQTRAFPLEQSWCARVHWPARGISMSPEQVQAVQNSFRTLEPVAESAMMKFYDRLFEVDPTLRTMFRSSREEQAKKLAMVVGVVVKSLDRPEQILGAVKELGRRHLAYGVTDAHYDAVGAALLWTLEQG